MDVKYLQRAALGFVSVVLVLAVFVYVLFHVTDGFSPGISTTPAVYGEYVERDGAEGYIFRHEVPIRSEYSGSINYSAADGERLSAGALAATVYENGSDSELTSRMVEIDRKIGILERSNISDNISVSDTKTVDEQIAGYLGHILSAKREGNHALAGNVSDELLVSLNRRELIVSSRASYDSEIAALRAERQQLAARLTGEYESVYLSESGYFYYDCDGYEKIFDPALLEDMTPEDFDRVLSALPDSGQYIGKNIVSQGWYLALRLDITEIGKYTEGERYEVDFDDYSDVSVSMTLERISASGGTALLVFGTGEMPEGFGFERRQSVSIVSERTEGLRFPASALRLNEGVEGVFVLYGNTVFFRAAQVIGSENGYVFVERDGKDVTETGEDGEQKLLWRAVALYDEVIVHGTGLYHSMIVN